jgi:hypothetical protein
MTTAIAVAGSKLQLAIDKIKDLKLVLVEPTEQPIVKIIEKIADIDSDNAFLVARSVTAMQGFDALVSESLQATNYGDRFNGITEAFNGILEYAQRQIAQEEKGGPSVTDRVGNIIIKFTKGDIADRFKGIETLYNSVVSDAGKTVTLQEGILDAYSLARLSLKEAEVAALQIEDKQKVHLAAAEDARAAAQALVDGAAADLPAADKARLELARDEAALARNREDARYQITKDLSEMLTVSYSVTETIFAKYAQAHQVLERLYQRGVVFYNVQRPVMTGMKATFTGILVVNEVTKAQVAMEDSMNRGLEALGQMSTKVLKEGVKAGYGPGIKASSVAVLVDSIVQFQKEFETDKQEARTLATVEVKAIRDKVEDAKRQVAKIANGPTVISLDKAA